MWANYVEPTGEEEESAEKPSEVNGHASSSKSESLSIVVTEVVDGANFFFQARA